MAFYSRDLLSSPLFKPFWKAAGAPGSADAAARGFVRRGEAREAGQLVAKGAETLKQLIEGRIDTKALQQALQGVVVKRKRGVVQGAGPVQPQFVTLVLPATLLVGLVRIHHANGRVLLVDCDHALTALARPLSSTEHHLLTATQQQGPRTPPKHGQRRAKGFGITIDLQLPDEDSLFGGADLLLLPEHPGLAFGSQGPGVSLPVPHPSDHLLPPSQALPSAPTTAGLLLRRAGGMRKPSLPLDDELFEQVGDLLFAPSFEDHDMLTTEEYEVDLMHQEQQVSPTSSQRQAGSTTEQQERTTTEATADNTAAPGTPPCSPFPSIFNIQAPPFAPHKPTLLPRHHLRTEPGAEGLVPSHMPSTQLFSARRLDGLAEDSAKRTSLFGDELPPLSPGTFSGLGLEQQFAAVTLSTVTTTTTTTTLQPKAQSQEVTAVQLGDRGGYVPVGVAGQRHGALDFMGKEGHVVPGEKQEQEEGVGHKRIRAQVDGAYRTVHGGLVSKVKYAGRTDKIDSLISGGLIPRDVMKRWQEDHQDILRPSPELLSSHHPAVDVKRDMLQERRVAVELPQGGVLGVAAEAGLLGVDVGQRDAEHRQGRQVVRGPGRVAVAVAGVGQVFKAGPELQRLVTDRVVTGMRLAERVILPPRKHARPARPAAEAGKRAVQGVEGLVQEPVYGVDLEEEEVWQEGIEERGSRLEQGLSELHLGDVNERVPIVDQLLFEADRIEETETDTRSAQGFIGREPSGQLHGPWNLIEPLPVEIVHEMAGCYKEQATMLSQRTRKVAAAYKAALDRLSAPLTAGKALRLSRFLKGASRLHAASWFTDSLVLMSCGALNLEQPGGAYAEVLIQPRVDATFPET